MKGRRKDHVSENCIAFANEHRLNSILHETIAPRIIKEVQLNTLLLTQVSLLKTILYQKLSGQHIPENIVDAVCDIDKNVFPEVL